ncbi:amidase [Kitasatospora sp. NPDC058032]|uniref:amidase n=1 Tax=Kitasatospora sp. NPDC058032 TaxID=3346307 RepID=UPI0036DA8677
MEHTFTLSLDDHQAGAESSTVLKFVALPAGCAVRADGPFFLECEQRAETLLEAVGQVVGAVRASDGLFLNDLGVEKLEEWSADGLNGFGAETVAQLLLLAVYRAELLGYTADDLVRFIRSVTSAPSGTESKGHQSRGSRS